MGKVVWDDEKSRKLLSILSEQKAKGKSKFSWPYIVTLFNAQSGDPQHHDRKTLYNHYSDSKDKFKCWEELQGLTGIACDPTTGIVDVQEQSLERWDAFLEKHKKHGMSIAKNGLPNLALLRTIFAGQSARGVGGCFSPAMARSQSYLSLNVEDLTIDEKEGSGHSETDNNEMDKNENNDTLFQSSASECQVLPNPVIRKATRTTGYKRKTEETISSVEAKRRQTSFDNVIELLSASGVGSSGGPSRAQRVSDALSAMRVPEERGDEYFVSAMKFLSDETRADNFLALRNDKQKWIYLKDLDIELSDYIVSLSC